MATKSNVVARLTVTRANGKTTIVEIHAGATFQKFYCFFTQDGRRRSTKTLLRTASRNEYLPVINAHLHKPGLDVIEKQLRSLMTQTNPVISSKLRIIKRRLYKKLINTAPDALGMARVQTVDLSHRTMYAVRLPVRSPKAIPVKRWLASLPAELKVG